MALENKFEGAGVRLAIKKATTWGTAVAIGAGNECKITGGSIPDSINFRVNNPEESLGNYDFDEPSLGNIEPNEENLDFSLRANNSGLDIAIYQAIGGIASWAQQGGTAAYLGTFYRDNPVGEFFTMAERLYNGTNTVYKEWPACKAKGITITWEKGQPVKVSIPVVKALTVMAASSLTNAATQWGNATLLEELNRLFSNNAVFRLNAQAGAALQASDAWNWSKITLNAPWNLNTGIYQVSGNSYIDEPVFDGTEGVTLTVELNAMENARWTEFTNRIAATNCSQNLYKADIETTGCVIASTYYREFNVYFPNIFMNTADAKTESTSLIPATMEFQCMTASAAPTGMTRTEAFYGTVQTDRVANPLA